MQQMQNALLQPRKQPVQARSQATVSAIFEASIQVLLDGGYRKMTTTRVAERAGVSIGTLYQYFPNRQALIAAVIDNYFTEVTTSLEHECRLLAGETLAELVIGLVDAIMAAKCRRIDVSRSLQEPLADIRGVARVKAASDRAAKIIAELLMSCRDADFDDAGYVAHLIVTSCRSMLQAAVIDGVGPAELAKLRIHMLAIVRGYLDTMKISGTSA